MRKISSIAALNAAAISLAVSLSCRANQKVELPDIHSHQILQTESGEIPSIVRVEDIHLHRGEYTIVEKIFRNGVRYSLGYDGVCREEPVQMSFEVFYQPYSHDGLGEIMSRDNYHPAKDSLLVFRDLASAQREMERSPLGSNLRFELIRPSLEHLAREAINERLK